MCNKNNNETIKKDDIKKQGNNDEPYFKHYDDIYLVSKDGYIYYRTKNDEYVKKAVKEGRYYTVTIKKKREYVHRIVAKLFCCGENTLDKKYNQRRKTVDHVKCRYNNKSENLEWVSQKENNKRYEEKKNRDELCKCEKCTVTV